MQNLIALIRSEFEWPVGYWEKNLVWKLLRN